MSRWCARLLAVLLAGAPLAQLRCATVCTAAARSADECHEQHPASSTARSGVEAVHHDCPQVTAAVVTASSRIAPISPALVSFARLAASPTVAAFADPATGRRSGGPPGRVPIPQRI